MKEVCEEWPYHLNNEGFAPLLSSLGQPTQDEYGVIRCKITTCPPLMDDVASPENTYSLCLFATFQLRRNTVSDMYSFIKASVRNSCSTPQIRIASEKSSTPWAKCVYSSSCFWRLQDTCPRLDRSGAKPSLFRRRGPSSQASCQAS